jgi:hypothetical protein
VAVAVVVQKAQADADWDAMERGLSLDKRLPSTAQWGQGSVGPAWVPVASG